MMMREYKNPIKRNGDFADPCVIRYNGRYYLYCTNGDIRCWSSKDLLDWKLEGPVIGPEEFPGLVPFAPEVVYWNGYFYMYTSPHGLGHYILRSESPTGPFHKITDNLGHNLDGSVFIDDDGQWYFYWADYAGILGCRMKSPTELTEPVNTGAYLHGWTEGPFVVKHRGRYYMTYTGNHYLSKGYRIHAAVSNHPLGTYTEDKNNPVVINTEGNVVGLGHSTTVLGPDMKSFYIVYHNLNPDRTRDLNIDLQSWHGQNTYIYGPTVTKQPAPQLPDFYIYPEEDPEKWLIRKGRMQREGAFYQTDGNEFICLSADKMQPMGAAEYNLKCGPGTDCFGILFGWHDEENYNRLEIDLEIKKIRVYSVQNKNEAILAEDCLPADFDGTKLHCVRLLCDEEVLSVWIDNRRQTGTDMASMEGRIGYYAKSGPMEIGFTGFSNGSFVDAERKWYKPIPGRIPACTALSEKRTEADQELVSLEAGKSLTYHINASKTAKYAINMYGYFTEKTKWRIILDTEEFSDAETTVDQDVPASGRGIIKSVVTLTEGRHRIQFFLQEGNVMLESIEMQEWTEVPQLAVYTVDRIGPYGKMLLGDNGWSNYTLEAELTAETGEDGEAGVIICGTQPSEGGEGNDPVLGINFFKGYFIGRNKTHMVLSKHAYDKKILCQKELKDTSGSLSKMKITVCIDNGRISIYSDNEKEPVITYSDEYPFTCGKVGVRTENGWVEGRLTVRNSENTYH